MPSISQARGLDRHQWSAVIASFLGWTLDAFDFFLMVFMFSAIAKEFHTNVAAVAIASTLTLAARPFGALIFGMLADRYGRRPVLMVGLGPALLVVMLRIWVKESPVFEAQRHTQAKRSPWVLLGIGVVALLVAMGPALVGAVDKTAMLKWVYFIDAPIALAGLWAFRKQWKIALYVVLLMTAFNFFSHGTQDLFPTFLQKEHKLSSQTVALLTVIMNLGAIMGGLTFGAWSERIGRRRAIVIAALLSLLMLPLWAFSHTVAMLAVGAFTMQVMVQGAWGVIPVHLNELSPSDARGAFPGYAYQLGNLLASGNAVWQAQIAEAHGDNYGLALALTAGVVAIVIAAVTFFGPERRGVDFAAA
jgi:SHS family lactate transporter-like MFS transporter